MKTWDAIVIGAGLIGISTALALRKAGASVLIVERGAAGREASHAAAGMLAHCDPHLPSALQPLAKASAQMYPEFVHELEDESGDRVDYRVEGTIQMLEQAEPPLSADAAPLAGDILAKLEPGLRMTCPYAAFLPEASVDPRLLLAAALKAAKHRGIELASGAEVTSLKVVQNHVTGVITEKTSFAAVTVINCGGAWAGHIPPLSLPIRPIKGQMLSKVVPVSYSEQGSPWSPRILRHVVRTPGAYIVPRSDGRLVIGSTLEDVGYDKRVDPATIHSLDHQASRFLPELAEARMLETWTGLRPATPDGLPIMGATAIDGYFVAAGHYRDGILLAPVTAWLMARLIRRLPLEVDISAFAPSRFGASTRYTEGEANNP